MNNKKPKPDIQPFRNVALLMQKLLSPGDFLRALTDAADSAHTFDYSDELKGLDPHYFLLRVIEDIAPPYLAGKGLNLTSDIAKGVYTIYKDFTAEEIHDRLGGILLAMGAGFKHGRGSSEYLRKQGCIIQIFFEIAAASILLLETEISNEHKS